MPSRARLWRFVRVTATPSSQISPLDGCSSPVMTLKSVVLPAPFGPISPVTWPASTWIEARSSASRPPKETDTVSISRSGIVISSRTAPELSAAGCRW